MQELQKNVVIDEHCINFPKERSKLTKGTFMV